MGSIEINYQVRYVIDKSIQHILNLCYFFRIIKRHEESVYCMAFAPDSSILLTACSIGNIRISYMENDTERNIGNYGITRCLIGHN